MVCYIAKNVESINIVQVCLNSTCLPKINDLIKSTVWLVVVPIVFFNTMLDLFPSVVSNLMSFPTLKYFSLYAQSDIHKPLLLIRGLNNVAIIVYMKHPFFQVLHVLSEFCWQQCLPYYHVWLIESLRSWEQRWNSIVDIPR